MPKSRVRSSSAFQHRSPIAQAVSAGGFVFFSALRGSDPVSGEVPQDPREQAERLFENLKGLLHEAGGQLADVVRVAVYMKDLQGDRPAFNDVWREQFGDDPPARFAVQVMDIGGAGDASRYLADVIAYIGPANSGASQGGRS